VLADTRTVRLALAPFLREGPGTRPPRGLGEDPTALVSEALALADSMTQGGRVMDYLTALAVILALDPTL
jgi:hypothetical protein